MRSDERANQAEIERDHDFRGNVESVAKTAGTLAATAATVASGGPIAARIAPFLSHYIPAELAMKGISRVAPKVGDFLKKGQSMGLDLEQGLEYVKEQFVGKEAKHATDDRNIIQQYDPELYTYIQQSVKKGVPVTEAGKNAMKHGRFARIIQDLVKDHKTSWSSILQTVFGAGQSEKSQEPAQAGQGQQKLMDILSKIQQARGAQ